MALAYAACRALFCFCLVCATCCVGCCRWLQCNRTVWLVTWRLCAKSCGSSEQNVTCHDVLLHACFLNQFTRAIRNPRYTRVLRFCVTVFVCSATGGVRNSLKTKNSSGKSSNHICVFLEIIFLCVVSESLFCCEHAVFLYFFQANIFVVNNGSSKIIYRGKCCVA